MADLTETQIENLITLAYNALVTAMTTPKPNYQVGDRTVSYADYIEMLNGQLNSYREMKTVIPAESAPIAIDNEISATGSDNTQYEGDSDE
jgi:hypothetical protein